MEKSDRVILDNAHMYDGEIAPWRRRVDRAIVCWVTWFAGVLVHHWLLLVNCGMGVFVTLPVAAPLLRAGGYENLSEWLYRGYNLACHQLPYRSLFISGQKMAYCERDLAIYTSVFICGLIFAAVRRKARPLDWRFYLAALIPIAIDGFTQLPGWRESTFELRILTGALFGSASTWLLFPYMEMTMRELHAAWEGSQLEVRSP